MLFVLVVCGDECIRGFNKKKKTNAKNDYFNKTDKNLDNRLEGNLKSG
jgi:hypothetical protein